MPASDVCREYLHNNCARGQSCKFLHPTAAIDSTPMVLVPHLDVCLDWRHGRCARDRCRFLHSELPLVSLQFCKDHLAERCNRASCKLYHGTLEQWAMQRAGFYSQPLYLPVMASAAAVGPSIRECPDYPCRDFARGKCERPRCRFLHQGRSQGLDPRGPVPPPLCRDFVRGSCQRTTCRFTHSLTSESLPSGTD